LARERNLFRERWHVTNNLSAAYKRVIEVRTWLELDFLFQAGAVMGMGNAAAAA
jgi:hypothetical protein